MDKVKSAIGFLISIWVLVALSPTQNLSGESPTGYRFKLDWHPFENNLAVVEDGQVHIYDLLLQRIGSYTCQCEQVTGLAWSLTGHYLAVATGEGRIQIVDPDSLMLLHDVQAFDPTYDGEINYLTWHPHQDIVAASGGDFVNVDTIKIFDAKEGILLHQFEEDEDIVVGLTDAMAWSPKGTYLGVASGGRMDTHVRVWEIASGDLLWSFEDFFDPVMNRITSIAFSTDENIAVVGGRTAITVIDIPTGNKVASLEEVNITNANITGNNVIAIVKNQNESGIIENEYVIDFNLDNENHDRILENIEGVSAFDWEPQGNQLATFSIVDDKLKIWDLDSQQLVLEETIPDVGEQVDIAWNGMGNAIAIATNDGYLDIIQME